ncbi:MAG: hypothetical protein AAGA38_11875 [Pseudomonadota bacterium]
MWIAFSTPKGAGFVSIVAKDREGRPTGPNPEDELSIRFRRTEDAAKLGIDDVILTPGGDYGSRAFLSRSAVAELMASMASTMDYTNFKSSIPSEDRDMLHACHDAWSVFGDLQPSGPYSTQPSP